MVEHGIIARSYSLIMVVKAHTHISSSSELNITYWYSIHTHDTHTATVLEKSVKCAMVLYKPL